MRLHRAVRAAAIAALWLLYASLPLVAAFDRADPLACCRKGGAHRCFTRFHGAAGAPSVGVESKGCPVAKAIPFHADAPAATTAFAAPQRQTPLVCAAVERPATRRVSHLSSRAPPPVA
ncbi:MAG: hypothetical protein JOZ54_20265 [Acidobacteria bacterium]|nr:hypothetical protein [Acidobacteriota bacterium]